MNKRRFIRNNLAYYWKKNLLLALGVAISGAVITGALMVGDSVKFSLNRIVEQRLGHVTHVLKAGDRYFTGDLTLRVGEALGVPASSVLLQEGSAIAGGGRIRLNHIQVLGVDEGFDRMAGTDRFYGALSGDSIIISRNLASRLNLSPGDEVLLRIRKASLIPLNAPFISDEGSVVTLRATIRAVADEGQLGRFNLKVSQTAPFNVFIPLSRIQELMDLAGRVNVMLLDAGGEADRDGIMAAVDAQFSAADAGLKLSFLEGLQQYEVKSDRVFIDDRIAAAMAGAHGPGEGILTYFVNELECSGRFTPYSFVSTLPDSWLRPGEVIINTWLAGDLDADRGDTIRMTYFQVGPLRELTEASRSFVIKAVVGMEGRFGDRDLMPDLPGLSDAGNCRDWETGVPIHLDSIRDKDEDYWDAFGGLPKAFVPVSAGLEMWKNRFGSYTAYRYGLTAEGTGGPGEEGAPAAADAAREIGSPVEVNVAAGMKALEDTLMERMDPSMLGFILEASRDRGHEAAVNGVDFSQLFGGLSFFLLAAGLLLTVLLFLLNLESREEQLRTLVVMGIPVRTIRQIMMAETLVVALAGAVAGLLLAVLYNRLVFLALNGVWKDVVRTEMMHVDVRATTLAIGTAATLAIALLALWFPLNRKLRRYFTSHRVNAFKAGRGIRMQRLSASVFISGGLVSLVLIGSQLLRMEAVNVPVFFSAGGLLLVSALFFFLWLLERREQPAGAGLSFRMLSWKNATRNRTRSMSIVILFAIGAFLVISTGSNRKDLFAHSEDHASGTGGFLYYAESTVPVLRNLDDPGVRYAFGLEGSYSFVQIRKAEGDDASCLNLNKIINPRVLGVDPAMLDQRFSFVSRTGSLDAAHPWLSLRSELPGGLIPAVADETVIKWGLGLGVGDTLHYSNATGGNMDLLLIGGLAPSVFQGSVIIDNGHFLEQFPESSGTQVFLVDGARADTALIQAEIGRGMRDLGWDMQLASARLAEFNSVTNAYLSIFMVMGALGLLLGTFGLVVVLSRSILERRQEIALLKAVGYGRKKILGLIAREYMILLSAGIATGFITAVIATLPSILSPHTGSSFRSILLWLAVLVVNGFFWILLVTWSALRDPEIYRGLRND
jgi:putative ABC transport system permease protein